MQREEKSIFPEELGQQLGRLRHRRGLSQAELAHLCELKRQQIQYFETGSRTPSLDQLLRIARALDTSVQWFLSGSNRPGSTVQNIAIELRSLGLIDLWVKAAEVPGAFRRAEEVIALAIAGDEPEARIVEGIPALLAWNQWNVSLLRAFARTIGRRTIYRLAWLADVALAIDRRGGFPDGCPGKADLTAFVKRVKIPSTKPWDDLGHPADAPPTSAIWKRWRISYAGELTNFHKRAEELASLRQAEGHLSLTNEERKHG
jgi:transcriptional regulator with XRE-family HTH domain